MAALLLDGVSKTYPNGHVAARGIELEVHDGEFLVLVGPSGCGKSTLLRLIAGLETPTDGRIWIGGVDVTSVPPQRRDLAMVFQSYALYPHMSVRDNLAYGLKVRGVDSATIAERVADVATALELADLLDRRPAQLSGGQRQRVALGRAMVRQPQAFLFDEPLSNLDPSLRAQARTELRRLHTRVKSTVVYVTHDQDEAMMLGSRVAVLRDGHIEQVAPPLELYAEPVNTFVAKFIGSPAMNLLPASMLGVEAPSGATAGIRPQDLLLNHPVAGDSAELHAVVDLVEPRGHDHVVHLRVSTSAAPAIVATVSGQSPPAIGSAVTVACPAARIHLFDSAGARLSRHR